MSDYDSESYSSEDDEDYVPSGEDYSEDDVNELVKEDDLEGEEQPQKKKSPKKSAKQILARNQKKGVLCLEGEEVKDVNSTTELKEDAPGNGSTEIVEQKEKKKADDLWARFLSDVGDKSKPPAAAQTPNKKDLSVTEEKPNQPQEVVKEAEKPKAPTKVTITKVFDFAGEEVKVTKEVDAASREAKSFFQNQQEQKELQSKSSPTATLAASTPTSSGVKRLCGLGGALGKITGKKQKMSTLEKSKLDWEAFKEKEGIGDELAIHNRGKEGYIERKAFLERVDFRQFELERSIRLSNMKQ
uniref:Craniofacial development protein 1 n=1 Tax=Callorhinchus milii TaxID=7868 RepID=V9KRR5_CALMI